MMLGKVAGRVVAVRKNPHLGDNRILSVCPIDLKGDPNGPPILALDRVDAGVGDTVLVNREGGSARIIFKDDEIPLQAVIVAVVEGIDVPKTR